MIFLRDFRGGVTAARTKLAVQQWKSARVLSTPQMCITWPPSPGTARHVVQERSVFSVIVAGTTEQFSFYFSAWGSRVGRNSCAAVLFIVHVLFGTDFHVFCLVFVQCGHGLFRPIFFLLFDILRAIGEGGYLSLDVFPLPASHHFDTVKLNSRQAGFLYLVAKRGVYSLKEMPHETAIGKNLFLTDMPSAIINGVVAFFFLLISCVNMPS